MEPTKRCMLIVLIIKLLVICGCSFGCNCGPSSNCGPLVGVIVKGFYYQPKNNYLRQQTINEAPPKIDEACLPTFYFNAKKNSDDHIDYSYHKINYCPISENRLQYDLDKPKRLVSWTGIRDVKWIFVENSEVTYWDLPYKIILKGMYGEFPKTSESILRSKRGSSSGSRKGRQSSIEPNNCENVRITFLKIGKADEGGNTAYYADEAIIPKYSYSISYLTQNGNWKNYQLPHISSHKSPAPLDGKLKNYVLLSLAEDGDIYWASCTYGERNMLFFVLSPLILQRKKGYQAFPQELHLEENFTSTIKFEYKGDAKGYNLPASRAYALYVATTFNGVETPKSKDF